MDLFIDKTNLLLSLEESELESDTELSSSLEAELSELSLLEYSFSNLNMTIYKEQLQL